MLKSLTLFIGAALLSGSGAFAADLPPEVLDNVMRACRPDYHRICNEVLPGDGRVGRCLQAHEEELSPPCLKAVKFAYAIGVCSADYHRYCENVEPGGGRIVQCLSQSLEGLSPACERVVSANAPYLNEEEDRYSGTSHAPERKYDSYSYGYGRDHDALRDRSYDSRDGYRDYSSSGRSYDTHRYEDERGPVR